MGRRNKAGVCSCGHEVGYWHDPETGRCMRGLEWRGHPAGAFGRCPCVRKVKGKAMASAKKATTVSVTVRREVVLRALNQIIEGFTALRDEILPLPTRSVSAFDEMTRAAEPPPKLEPPPEKDKWPSDPRGPLEHVAELDSWMNGAAGGAAKRLKELEAADALTRAERAVLSVLAQPKNAAGVERKRLAMWAGYSHGSGSFAKTLADLRADGLIDGDGGAPIKITDAGRAEVGPVKPLPTGWQLREWWERRRPKAESDILEALALHGALARADLAERSDKSANSGSFAKALANLRALGLIEGRSPISLAEDLR